MVVGGRFELTSPLGRGAMGEVWRARHTTLGTDVAVKLVAVTAVAAEVSQRLLVEAKAAATIQSPYVARSFDMGQDGGVAWIVMELLVGETLDARLSRGPLSPNELAAVFADVTKGVAAAHARGVVHRDLKPQNVFLAETDSGRIAKVLDFGIAKTTGAQRTQEGIVVGTPAYLSREQIMGTRPVDSYADLWALAIMAYECLTGRLPYRATTMAELFVEIVGPSLEQRVRDPALPPAFAGWLGKALDREPERRFGTALDLGQALELALLEGVAPPAPPRSGRTQLALVASLILGVFGLVAIAVFLAAGPRRGSAVAASNDTSPALPAQASPSATSAGAPSVSTPPVGSAAPVAPLPAASASASPSAKKPTAKAYDPWGF
jgi:serine/threonine-protein kinase